MDRNPPASVAAAGDAAIASPDEVHAYWFGDQPWSHAKMWFEAGQRLDDEVRRRFLPTVEAALRGELDAWASQPHGRLCLIVVLDQFTRHVYRGDPRFVAGDSKAQALAVAALDAGWDDGMRSDEKLFLTLPLEHAEDVRLQQRSLAATRRLAAAHPELAEAEQYAKQHADIVFRFGRFPDRNRILGRRSTPEELAFLEQVHLPWFET